MRQKCLVLLSLLRFKNVVIKVMFFSISNPSKVLMIKIKAQMSSLCDISICDVYFEV